MEGSNSNDEFTDLQTPARLLYERFVKWCKANGEYSDCEKRFAEKLNAKGLTKKRSKAGRFWVGVSLIEVEPHEV